MSSESNSADQTSRYRPQTESTTFIETSGGLLTDQLVQKLRARDCNESAVDPQTFALPGEDPPTDGAIEDTIAKHWEALLERWDSVTQDNELFGMDVSAARDKWIIPLIEALDFAPVYNQGHLAADGVTAALSHYGWDHPESVDSFGTMDGEIPPVIHTIQPGSKGADISEHGLGDGSHPGAEGRHKSPHDELQTFLNASDDQQWGVVTDGLKLRVLRDYYHTYTRGYVEFDLENIFTNRNYRDFRALFRLCHASRFIPADDAGPEDDEPESPLEELYQIALSTGVKVGQGLQSNVVSAIETLGNGFLNEDIRAAIADSNQDAAEAYYQDILYVVYRLLFLLFAEQRGMMAERDSLYTEEYSVTKLRERSERREEGARNADLWEGLQATFRLVGQGDEALNVPGYNGGLFDDEKLSYITEADCPNENLLRAVYNLTHVEQDGFQQRISYADLGVEEIGAVYESLLEFTPQVAVDVVELGDRTVSPGRFYLDNRGMERKETGSYYTDPGLVNELIESALEPVVNERVDYDADTEKQEQQLLNISVCDPAVGSGAFLIAANDYLGQELAQIRSESAYPDEKIVRRARRTVAQHCLYGVDLNPMAVELAKVSLWINSAVEDKPLSFLDHRIKQGNSLIGTTSELVKEGVPEDAFETSGGRDWHEGNAVRKEVRKQNSGVQSGLDWDWDEGDEYVSIAEELDQIEEDRIDDVQKKKQLFDEFRNSDALQREQLVHDVWTAAFYWPMDGSITPYPTPETIEKIRRNPPEAVNASAEDTEGLESVRAFASEIATSQDFFHWPLEFPAIYSNQGGFDCILGNPPWERVELKEKEYFAVSQPQIANARNASERKKLISELEEANPELYTQYQNDKIRLEQRTKFLQNSGRYSLTGRGNLNTYALFSELSLDEINGQGHAGIIVPTGIATNSRTQYFFSHLVDSKRLNSLIDFENKHGIFTDVHKSYRFCLLTMVGASQAKDNIKLGFGLSKIEEFEEDNRLFKLDQETIQRINPNTNNLPTIENPADVRLIDKIYSETGALKVKNQEDGNPWDIESGGEFHMSHAASLFRTKSELRDNGWVLNNNSFEKSQERYIPLYESKLFHQYNHRFATFEGVTEEEIDDGKAKELSLEDLNNKQKVSLPRYWIPEEEFTEKHRGDWHLALRTITRSTDSRTVIGSILPRVGAADSLSVFNGPDASESLVLLSLLNSYVLDYVARQKISGSNLNYYMIWQLPIPSPGHIKQFKLEGEPVDQHRGCHRTITTPKSRVNAEMVWPQRPCKMILR
ncbi:Eco57I restriction-modification methylase domain-containing protein [Salinibaculum salinum]|uniref:Eco57I restriction-modification methylase domain-containing protein n=1 Tax=Salinibaculum salinum TaxID=3131996 RepID=UPI0030EC2D5A